MKFKKAFAWILAVAMIISLMPSMAFATSTNTVNKVPTVAANGAMPEIAISLKINDDSWAGETPTVKLTFDNAKWVEKPSIGTRNIVPEPNAGNIGEWMIKADDPSTSSFTEGLRISTGSAITNVVSVSNNSVEFQFTPDPTATDGDVIKLTFLEGTLKSGADDGEVVINIDGGSSVVSSKPLTVAVVGSSTTIANVTGDVVDTERIAAIQAATFEIRETTINSITWDQQFKMTLPKGVKWVKGKTNIVGNLGAVEAITYEDDDRTLVCYLKVIGNHDPKNVDVITIEPYIQITREAAMGEIPVTIRGINGGTVTSSTMATEPDAKVVTDAAGLVIANYTEAAVKVYTVDEEKLPTIVAGKYTDKNDKYFTVSVTLEESMVDALTSGRFVDISFPEEVQVLPSWQDKNGNGVVESTTDVTIPEFKVKYNNSGAISVYNDTHGAVSHVNYYNTLNKNASAVEFTIPDDSYTRWESGETNTVTFTIPVTVEAGFEGDIVATVSGAKAGVETTELVVAKAVAPVTVTSTAADLKNGVQQQSIGDIVITENGIGYIGDYDWVDANINSDPAGVGYDSTTTPTDGDQNYAGNEIRISIDTLGLTGMVFEDVESVEVTAGDLEIGKTSVNSGVIIIPIAFRSADEASTITLKNVTVALNRTLPEGGYDMHIAGGALVENTLCNDDAFSGSAVVAEDYVNIVTPAEDTVAQIVDSKFVIGATSFTVNGETYEMDAAAYIDENDRTMVPIRYFAMACGIPEEDISWDQATQTATITTPARVVKITMGQDTIWVSDGTNIQMDTVAVNKADRIYVPARFMANALGYEVEWDAATRTVSIF